MQEIFPSVDELADLIRNGLFGRKKVNFEDLYRLVYRICIADKCKVSKIGVWKKVQEDQERMKRDQGWMLYHGLKRWLKRDLLHRIREKLRKETSLEKVCNILSLVHEAISEMNLVFTFFNKEWIEFERRKKKDLPDVQQLATQVWSELLIESNFQCLQHVVRLVADQLDFARDQELSNIDTLLHVSEIMKLLSVTFSDWSKKTLVAIEIISPLEQRTYSYYASKRAKIDRDIYVDWVWDQLQKENCRLPLIFQDLEFREGILLQFTKVNIIEAVDLFLQDLEQNLIHPTPKLRTIFLIFQSHPSTQELFRQKVKMLISQIGSERMNGSSDHVSLIIELVMQFHDIFNLYFVEDPLILQEICTACRQFINHRNNDSQFAEKIAEQFAHQFCFFLREKDFEKHLPSYVTVLKLLHEQETFFLHTKYYLAKRLLRSPDLDVEKLWIMNFSNIAAARISLKLKRMFQDILNSESLTAAFHKLVHTGIDMHFRILTTSSWPQMTISSYAYPPEFAELHSSFESYYHTQFSDKAKLSWVPGIENGIIQCNIYEKPISILVNLPQYTILRQFNERDCVDLHDLSFIFQGYNQAEINRTVKFLTNFGILLVNNGSLSLNPNSTFLGGKRKFNLVGNINSKPKSEDIEPVQNVVIQKQDRVLMIEAIIIRIMKATKELDYHNLINKTVEKAHPNFHPPFAMIKQCIDRLLDRGFIERTHNQKERSVLRYLG